MKDIDIIELPGLQDMADIMVSGAKTGVITSALFMYENTCELLCMLLTAGAKIGLISMEAEYIDGYNMGYYVTIFPDMEVDICPAWDRDAEKYLYEYADVYFFDGDAKASVLKLYEGKSCYEVRFVGGDTICVYHNGDKFECVVSEKEDDEHCVCGCCDCTECTSDSITTDKNDYVVSAYKALLGIKEILDDLFED